MTDGTGAGHVGLDVLAEVDEGVAGPEVDRAARAHLEHCAECGGRLAQLRTTRALLSALPAEPMPEAVRSRVDTALQRAAAEPSGTVVPMSRRTRVWHSPAVAGAAAVAAVVVLLGALVAGHVIHRGNSSSSSTASAPVPAAGNNQGGAGSTPAVKEWATGANYTVTSIPTLVPRLITGTPPPNATGSGAGGTSSFAANSATPRAAPAQSSPLTTSLDKSAITPAAMRADISAVLACGTILAGGVPTLPIAVDFASWDGKPAVIFVLPAVNHPELLDVWVVRSSCSTSSLDVYFRRIPRPTG